MKHLRLTSLILATVAFYAAGMWLTYWVVVNL